jgi:hypothetical protein
MAPARREDQLDPRALVALEDRIDRPGLVVPEVRVVLAVQLRLSGQAHLARKQQDQEP